MKQAAFYTKICLVFVMLWKLPAAQAQEDSWYKRLGDELYQRGKYAEALRSYHKYQPNHADDKGALLRMAICSYRTNQIEQARLYLEAVISDQEEPTIDPQAFYYLGKVEQAELQFKQAAKYYKLFLKNEKSDAPLRLAAKKNLLHCASGIRLSQHEDLVYAESLGKFVNTINDEFGSVSSPNYDNRIYFSTLRPTSQAVNVSLPADEDSLAATILYTQTLNGKWYPARPVDSKSALTSMLLGFNADGTQMYYRQTTGPDSTSIFVNFFQKKYPDQQLTLPVNIAAGDCDFRFFTDSLVLFASRRKGGYGGYDLYWTSYLKGQWSAPKNLGPLVNSIWDERFPFLAEDGQTLYFSSNDPRRSAGGFDIFRAVFNGATQQWLSPENMGLLINSAADDTHFHLTKDGYRAFFTSARKEGEGGQDLYAAYFAKARPEMLRNSTTSPFHFILNGEQSFASGRDATKPSFPVFQFSYDTTGEVIYPANEKELQRLITYLQIHPDWRLLINFNSEKNLSEALSLPKQLLRYLTQQQISAERIQLQVVRQSTPTLTAFAFPPIEAQIDFLSQPGQLAYPSTNAWQGLTHRVQLTPEDGERLATTGRFPQQIIELSTQGTIWHTVGVYRTLASAEQLQAELRRQGIPAAKIGHYWHGIRLSAKEAAYLKENYAYLW